MGNLQHSKDQEKETKNFGTKLSELAIEVLQTSITNKSIRIDYWVRLSCSPHEAWRIIIDLRSIGIEVISTAQPLRLYSPFARCLLVSYIIDPIEEEDST
jgi:hypothetical protein